MKSVLALTVSLLGLTACASGAGGGGSYDPNASETLGRVLSRSDTGTTAGQSSRHVIVPIGGLFIPLPLDRGSVPMPVFEYKLALDDGRNVSLFSWYAEHPVGGCVKLFESKRSDYPRLINYSGCKS